MRFRYRGLDEEDRPAAGVVEAANYDAARQQLQEGGLVISELAVDRPLWSRLAGGARAEELGDLCGELARLADRQTPLPAALLAQAKDLKNRSFAGALERVATGLERGEALADLLGREREHFPPLLPVLVRAGEKAGDLATPLRLAAGHAWRAAELRHRVRAAMFYPLVVVLLTGALIFGLLPPVVEQLEELRRLFYPLGAEYVPPQSWIAYIYGWREVILGVGGGVFGGGLLLGWLGRHSRLAGRIRHWLIWNLPMVGRVSRAAFLGNFWLTLHLLVKAEIPLGESLRLLAGLEDSPDLAGNILTIAEEVEAGGDFAAGLDEHLPVIPALQVFLIQTGLQRGQLAETLTELAASAERRATREAECLAAILPPVLLLVAASLVLLSATAILHEVQMLSWLFEDSCI